MKLTAFAFTLLLPVAAAGADWRFTDVTEQAGLRYSQGYTAGLSIGAGEVQAGGVAAGDYDRDGYVDLYVVRGNVGPNLLFHNRGDGTFAEVGAAAGVDFSGEFGTGDLRRRRRRRLVGPAHPRSRVCAESPLL